MCIIVYKPIGKKIPGREILQRCFNNNDDGAGYMFNDNENVIIKKGFTAFDTFYKQLKDDAKQYDFRNKNVILHFRIGTSGGLNKNKTHPFILTNKSKLINKYNGGALTCDVGVVHNGVLNDYVYGGLSDTQNFIKDFLYDVYYSDLKENIKNKIIKNELNGNKLIILDKKGNVKKYGDFIYDNGVYYSNTSYKDRYYYTSSNYQSIYDYAYKNIKVNTTDENETTENDETKKDNNYNSYYDYIKDNFKKIETPRFYCDGYEIEKTNGYNYYIDDFTGEIYETNEQYKTASYIGNNYDNNYDYL